MGLCHDHDPLQVTESTTPVGQDEEEGFGESIGSISSSSCDRPALDKECKKPRMLALCGSCSNNEVTKLQLQHLHITDDHYDILYIHGAIDADENEELAGLVYGPFYSWIDKSETKKVNDSIVESVRHVIETVHTHGPFDGVYGFSQGGLIAALAAGIHEDPMLRDAMEDTYSNQTHAFAHHHHVVEVNGPPFEFAILACSGPSLSEGLGNVTCSIRSGYRKGSAGQDRLSNLLEVQSLGSVDFLENDPMEAEDSFAHSDPCLDRNSIHKHNGRALLGLDEVYSTMQDSNRDAPVGLDGLSNLIRVRSLHLVGIEDPHKRDSEHVAQMFSDSNVAYFPGGHIVRRSDMHLITTINKFTNQDSSSPTPNHLLEMSEFKPVSPISSIAVQPHTQVALVHLHHELLPSGKQRATIVNCLKAQPGDTPFLFNARNPKNVSTTYGQALNFIQGGAGDLRRLGVKPGDVVAYCTPHGGSAVAALAFLSIGAQTMAAPFAPTMMTPDALDALDQFNPKHLILFKGIDSPGVEDAFQQYAQDGKATLHYATISGPEKPGQFEFSSQDVHKKLSDFPKLSNPAKGNCLLLRTSGTTARPKGVPLEQGALVNNGAIIAASLELQVTDVCYSVMPLFHIGGLSASILCTLASGGSVCCDEETFDPSRMIDALAISNPQPTWYSSVPTIHNATVGFVRDHAKNDPKYAGYGINNGVWKGGHSLRMIRSGAAALFASDAEALSKAYGGLPIYPTYSMSEQMPISQPPSGKGDTIKDKPGTVGVPVAASLAIVSRSHLRPLPYGEEGEIAISGPTVMQRYLDNPSADAKSYFYLGGSRWLLTGDVGLLDSDGFLSLKGRAKELIKKGGEQVSPYEVEEVLLGHPWVQTPICFSCPSVMYGEEVGCAIVLKPDAPISAANEVIKSLRTFMKDKRFAPVKWPTKWAIVDDKDLPKTKTKKYIRIGLAERLGLDKEEGSEIRSIEKKAKIDWGVISGFRFCLACYVMFMHIGSNESWGSFNNLRSWPWHVHCFYTLGGFSMASTMNPVIKKKFSYFCSRIGHMYPMYAMSLLFGLANLLVVCRPATFDPDFHWDGQPTDETRGFFCEGTPLFKTSWWGSLVSTIITYTMGLAVTPIWPASWWLGYYLWFSSMYYQCLAVYPEIYNYMFTKTRKNLRYLLKLMFGLQTLNIAILCAFWFLARAGLSYNHYDPDSGEAKPTDEYDNAYGSAPVIHNAVVLSFYLFAPFWILYFIIGAVLAFIYDAMKPAEQHNARVWGYIADGCTLIQIALGVAIVCQGTQTYGEAADPIYFRPSHADQYTDASSTNRLWDNICGRMVAPLTTVWIFAMSTGYTAKILRGNYIVTTLSPTSYNCFLFHQMVGQWYYAATRPGEFWNWWQYRKDFYWFSPGPCPVEWYEYFFIVGITVAFANFMDHTFIGSIRLLFGWILEFVRGKQDAEDVDVAKTLCAVITNMTGIEPDMESALDEVGLASVGMPVIAGLINNAFAKQGNPISVSAPGLVRAKSIKDIIGVIEDARALMEHDGV